MQIFDEFGTDVLQGLGMGCDANATTNQPVLYSGTSVHPLIDGLSKLWLHVGDQFAASAQLTITLIFARGY